MSLCGYVPLYLLVELYSRVVIFKPYTQCAHSIDAERETSNLTTSNGGNSRNNIAGKVKVLEKDGFFESNESCTRSSNEKNSKEKKCGKDATDGGNLDMCSHSQNYSRNIAYKISSSGVRVEYHLLCTALALLLAYFVVDGFIQKVSRRLTNLAFILAVSAGICRIIFLYSFRLISFSLCLLSLSHTHALLTLFLNHSTSLPLSLVLYYLDQYLYYQTNREKFLLVKFLHW